MAHDWTQLPRWAPVFDTIAEELKPSDIMNFLVAIGYDPPESWRKTYLKLYRELPGLIPWIELSTRMGCTVSLIGSDIRKLIMYVHNSIKYPLHSDEPLVIWPISTLPWKVDYEPGSDNKHKPRLMTIPRNPLDGKLGVVRIRSRREICENYAMGTLDDGCTMEPPYRDVTSVMLHSAYTFARLRKGHVFNGLSGNPCILLVGGLSTYKWPFPTMTIRNKLGQKVEPPIVEFERDLVKAHAYCCNNDIVYRGSNLFVTLDHCKAKYDEDALNEIRDNQIASENCSNVDIICMRVINIHPSNGRRLLTLGNGASWGYERTLNMMLPSVCEVKKDLPPIAPDGFVKELMNMNHFYEAYTPDPMCREQSARSIIKGLVDSVLKKYSDYII